MMSSLRKVVVAMDSFKGSLSTEEAGHCVATSLQNTCPHCQVEVLPIGDGGEGTVLALTHALRGKIITTRAHDSLMRPCSAYYGELANHTAVIEVASTCGLAQLLPSERNPRFTSSYGCGEVILEALRNGNTHILLCLGGSSTNDAGMGLLTALGFRFLDKDGVSLPPYGESLPKIDHIVCHDVHPSLKQVHFQLLSDVINPLCGKHGAAHVYARQKGANSKDILFLDNGLNHFADIVLREFGKEVRFIAGSGAAGGIGAGCLGMLPCEITSGMDYVLRAIRFEEHLQHADLVITGEGKIDSQSFMGKVLQRILACCNKHHVPVIALGGQVSDDLTTLPQGLIGAYNIHPQGLSLEDAMNSEQTLKDLFTTTSHVIRELLSSGML